MSVTDADQFTEILWRTVEDDALLSGLWNRDEIAGYFNQRQNRFNRDTLIMLAQMPGIVGVAGTTSYPLPDDWVATQRVTWKDLTGAVSAIDRGDRFSADLLIGASGSGGPAKPVLYDDHVGGSRMIDIYPAPVNNGEIGLLYASVLETLHFDPNTPDIFDIPDDFVPYVMYGVLEDMFSKDGRGKDLARAHYCRMRYEEGVALAAFFLGGFI